MFLLSQCAIPFKDKGADSVSTSKFWQNAGCATLTVLILHWYWSNPITWDIIIAYGAIVIGNRAASKYIESKYGSNSSAPDPVSPPVDKDSGSRSRYRK